MAMKNFSELQAKQKEIQEKMDELKNESIEWIKCVLMACGGLLTFKEDGEDEDLFPCAVTIDRFSGEELMVVRKLYIDGNEDVMVEVEDESAYDIIDLKEEDVYGIADYISNYWQVEE